MFALRWEDFEDSPAAFERLVKQLILREHHGATSIDGRGSDGGIDVRWDSPSGLVIFECKKFTRISGPQKRQIQQSLARAAKHHPSRWILVVPTDPTPALHAWFTELGPDYSFPLEWRGRTWLDERMAANPDLRAGALHHDATDDAQVDHTSTVSTNNELVAESAESVIQAGIVHGGVHVYSPSRFTTPKWAAVLGVIATLAICLIAIAQFVPLPPKQSSRPATCGDIGNDKPGVHDKIWYVPFTNAYKRGGSEAALGCPITDDPSGYVHNWAKGVSQDLAGGRAGTARIMSLHNPDRVIIMQGAYHRAYTFGKNLGDKVLGTDAAQHMGYPVSDPKSCGNAEVALLDEAERSVAGSIQTPGAMVTSALTNQLVWVPKDIWQPYKALGGPLGRLGRPIGTATEGPSGLLQHFEHGYITTTDGVAKTDIEERWEPEPVPTVTVDECLG